LLRHRVLAERFAARINRGFEEPYWDRCRQANSLLLPLRSDHGALWRDCDASIADRWSCDRVVARRIHHHHGQARCARGKTKQRTDCLDHASPVLSVVPRVGVDDLHPSGCALLLYSGHHDLLYHAGGAADPRLRHEVPKREASGAGADPRLDSTRDFLDAGAARDRHGDLRMGRRSLLSGDASAEVCDGYLWHRKTMDVEVSAPRRTA